MTTDSSCGTYLPGHRVHWIHANKAASDRGVVVRVVELSGIEVVLELDGDVRLYRNHTTRHIQEVLSRRHVEVRLCERWHLLKIGRGGTWTLFHLAEADALWRMCASEASYYEELFGPQPG